MKARSLLRVCARGAIASVVCLLFIGSGRVPDRDVVTAVRAALASPQADSRAAALQWIARDARTHDPSLIRTIFADLQDRDNEVRAGALANMGWIYARARAGRTVADRTTRDRALAAVEQALRQTADRNRRLVAIDLLKGATPDSEAYAHAEVKTDSPLVYEPAIRRTVVQLLADQASSLRSELLDLVQQSPRLQSDPAILNATARALSDDSLSVRSAAVDVLSTVAQNGLPERRTQVRPLLRRALDSDDPNVQLRAAQALHVPVPPRKAAPAIVSLSGAKLKAADVPYDFNYFTAFVQPLFVKRYGTSACVNCHTPDANASGRFRILRPGPDGHYTLEQSKTNFVSLLSVIDQKHTDKSPLLVKPLDPRASEGELHGETHDGGVFWPNQFDPDFQTVRDWLKGAKLETPPEKQLSFDFFVQHVEPIFSTPGPDGFACINCHSTHAILHLQSPATREGTFSVQQLRNNYEAAHRVVDEAAPGNSFIVRKPTSLREGEPGGLSHAGGVRWPQKKESWQYKALIAWISQRNLAGGSASPAGVSVSAQSKH